MTIHPAINLEAFLILALTLAVGCGTQTPSSEASIRSALRNTVQPGMTIDEVEKVVGRAEPASEIERKVMKIGMTDPSDPTKAPDGYQADDEFFSCNLDGIKVFLQFRDGKLINFNPGIY